MEAMIERGTIFHAVAHSATDVFPTHLSAALKQGEDINGKSNGITPLYLAACLTPTRGDGVTQKAQLLIQNGANINLPMDAGEEPISQFLKAYLHNTVDFDLPNVYEGQTPLHAAAKNLNCKMIEFLLEEGALGSKAKETTGETALHFAICQDYYAHYVSPDNVIIEKVT